MLCVIIYNGQVQPFGTIIDDLIEQIGEVFIALLVYHIFFFSDLNADADARVKMGWSMIGTMSLALFLCYIYLFFRAISSIFRFFKLRLQHRKAMI